MMFRTTTIRFIFAVFVLFVFVAPFPQTQQRVFAQQGNAVSGFIFGLERRPLGEVYVELLDEFSRTLQRTRTNGSGRYVFRGLGSGRFVIRAMPYGTDYQEQEQEIEIVNFSRSDGAGGLIRSGFSNEHRDFFLRPRKGTPTAMGTPSTIFVQADVPDQARKLYEKAIADLGDKKEREGLEGLKSALEIYPKYYAALERLGTEYVRLGHFEVAHILFNIAVDVNPKGFNSWYGKAYSLYSLKKFNEAIPAAQKAVELGPVSLDALLLSGVLMKYAKRFDVAEKHLLKAKELANGMNPQIHWELALLYGNDLKRYSEAAKELTLYLKAQPNLKDAEKIKKLIKDFETKAQTS